MHLILRRLISPAATLAITFLAAAVLLGCANDTLAQPIPVPGDAAGSQLEYPGDVRWHTMPRYLFGLDTNIPATAGLHADEAPWDDPRMVEAFRQVRIDTLRYPGGLAPFYNWRTEHQEPPHPFGRKMQDWMLKVRGNQAGFLDLCQQLDMRPVFVFNLLQGDPADQRQWVDSLVGDDGQPAVTHWELGNEVPDAGIFKKGKYKGPIQTPEDYVKAAKAIGQPLLARWPDLRIAIVGAPPVHLPQIHVPDQEKPETRHWNEVLGADRSYYNAVVQHFYMPPWLNFQEQVNWDHKQRAQWLFALGDAYPRWVTDYHREYYGDLPLWLTEVGMVNWELPWGEPRKEAEMAWWSRLCEINYLIALVAHDGPIEMVMKHNAVAPRPHMPIHAVPEDGKLKEANVIFPIGTMIGHIGEATKGGGRIANIRVPGTSEFDGFLRAEGQKFPTVRLVATQTDTGTHLMVVNRGDHAQSVPLPAGSWSGHVYHAPLQALDDAVKTEQRRVADGQVLEMPAYSFVYLKRD